MQTSEGQPSAQTGNADLRGTLSQQIQVTFWPVLAWAWMEEMMLSCSCACLWMQVWLCIVIDGMAARLQLQIGVAAEKYMHKSML